LTLDNEGIVKYIDDLDKQTKAIRNEALKFTWFMRGGVTYNEAMFLSQQEREIIGSIIKEHMETTKESGLPFF